MATLGAALLLSPGLVARRSRAQQRASATLGSTFLGSTGTALAARRNAPKAQSVLGAAVCLGGIGTAAQVGKKNVLIYNTDGGAHAPIGFWLSKVLKANGHDVTIMVPGDASSEKLKKPPFKYWPELAALGVTAVFGAPSAIGSVTSNAKFDVVVENCGKKLEEVQPVIDYAAATGASQFFYVSSAGMYIPTDEVPYIEGDAIKATADQAGVERQLRVSGLNYAVFRPQYITGYGSNKDCEEWFFDRLVRNRPVPIPGSGMQLTSVTHAEDLGEMIAAAVGAETARDTLFNCVGDRAVTLDGMARLCASAAGVAKFQIVHYDPKKMPASVDVGKAFPFRAVHFYSEPRAAKAKLGWTPRHKLDEALAERFAFYKASGRHTKDMAGKFDADDAIIAAVLDAHH